MDNYGTQKHAESKAWLKRNPRFVLTSSRQFQLDESCREMVRPPG